MCIGPNVAGRANCQSSPSPSDALGGRSPLAAVASDPGAEKVSNMLYQMEHGIYS